METAKIWHLKSVHSERKKMDILWGAWVKETRYNEDTKTYDFSGIYDTIFKPRKADYPFFTDLSLVFACQATAAEYDRTFRLTLDLIDRDAINHLFTLEEDIEIESGDSPHRWYESFTLNGIEFNEPNQYSLSMLIDGQEKHAIPLWVVSPKGIIIDNEKDSKTEFWAEDLPNIRGE